MAVASGTTTPIECVAAFQNESLKSAKGSYNDDYFGYARNV